MITDNVASHAAHSSLRQPCLKYLKTLNFLEADDSMKFPFIDRLRGSLSVVTKNLHFFPRLTYLDLSITVDEADLFGLLEKLKLLPELEHLTLKGIALRHSMRSMVPLLLKLKKLEMLCLKIEDFSKEELCYVRDAFKGKLRQLTIKVENYGKTSRHLWILR